MYVPSPANPVTMQCVMSYQNRITDTVNKYSALPFTIENSCRLLQELRSIVSDAEFDLVPIDILPFPIYFRVGRLRYRIDNNCTLYVDCEDVDSIT